MSNPMRSGRVCIFVAVIYLPRVLKAKTNLEHQGVYLVDRDILQKRTPASIQGYVRSTSFAKGGQVAASQPAAPDVST